MTMSQGKDILEIVPQEYVCVTFWLLICLKGDGGRIPTGIELEERDSYEVRGGGDRREY